MSGGGFGNPGGPVKRIEREMEDLKRELERLVELIQNQQEKPDDSKEEVNGLGKLEFKPEDFVIEDGPTFLINGVVMTPKNLRDYVAVQANMILLRKLRDAPVVYGDPGPIGTWGPDEESCDTHRARLVCVEEIECEPSLDKMDD